MQKLPILPDTILTQIFENMWHLWATVSVDLLLFIVFLVHLILMLSKYAVYLG